MTLKFTMYIQQERRVWSEAHYLLGQTDVSAQLAAATSLATKRQNCLGNNSFVTRIRVSTDPAARVYRDYDFAFAGGQWPSDPTGEIYDSAFANLALLVRITGLVQGALQPSPPKNLYLAGAPSYIFEVAAPGGGDYVLRPQFSGFFDAYLNYLTTGFTGTDWAYRTRTKGVPTQATGLVTNAQTPVQIGVTCPNIAGVVAGSKVYATGWRRQNTRQPNLQGLYVVASVVPVAGSATMSNYFLYNTAFVNPLNYNVPGFLTAYNYNFAGYVTYGVVQAVTRKRGGSYGLPRGRSRIRV